MFYHPHPYPPFIPKSATKLIVGTLPPPRFSTGELKEDDVNFCYGSRDGQLWKILEQIFDVKLDYAPTEEAKQQRIAILEKYGIGVCDMVEACYREKVDASDLGILNPSFRPIIPILKEHPAIDTLLFTGGNSKNGPEYFFREYLKDYPEISLDIVDNKVPRIHQFQLESRIIKTVSLTAPSGAANRAVGSMKAYKEMKKQNPKFNTIDFRVLQYKPFFLK